MNTKPQPGELWVDQYGYGRVVFIITSLYISEDVLIDLTGRWVLKVIDLTNKQVEKVIWFDEESQWVPLTFK